jgi:hypothetical protein
VPRTGVCRDLGARPRDNIGAHAVPGTHFALTDRTHASARPEFRRLRLRAAVAAAAPSSFPAANGGIRSLMCKPAAASLSAHRLAIGVVVLLVVVGAAGQPSAGAESTGSWSAPPPGRSRSHDLMDNCYYP